MNALVSDPGDTFRVVELPLGAATRLSALQALVGGWVEAFSGGSWVAFLNEDGKGAGLAVNRAATVVLDALRPGFASRDYAVGTVVFMGRSGPDTADVPDEVVAMFERYRDGGVV